MSLLVLHTDNPNFCNTSYVPMGLALLTVSRYHSLPLLLSIILTYIFVTHIDGVILKLRRHVLPRSTRLHKLFNMYNVNLASTTLTLATMFNIITTMPLGIYHSIYGDHVGFMSIKLAAILEDVKNNQDLPAVILNMLSNSIVEVKVSTIKPTDKYYATPARISRNSITSFMYALAGIITSVTLGFHRLRMHKNRRRMSLFRTELMHHTVNFETSSECVSLAQVKISLTDTSPAGLHLYLVSPLFGIELPFKMTILVVTFIVSLIPVAGSLISNTIIIISSLDASLYATLTSLVFLAIIHRLRYLLNTEIVGPEIESSA